MKITLSNSNRSTIFAFIFPALYWVYLGFTCQTEVRWDSLQFEELGRMIAQQGWAEFLRTGPHREPLYPLLISFAMKIGDWLGFPYLKILISLQFVMLFMTQLFAYKILHNLHIRGISRSLAVFYIGVSPGFVNCALSLYSEILVLPLIPLAILILTNAFQKMDCPKVSLLLRSGAALGLIFATLTFVKGVFEPMTPVILFCALVLLKRFSPSAGHIKRSIAIISIALIIFGSLLGVYKSANKAFNGHFTITDRGLWMFYGSTARRMEPLPPKRLLAGLAFIPGEGFCKRFFSEEECSFWSFQTSDGFGMNKLREFTAQNIPNDQLNKEFFRLSAQMITANPAQYFGLLALEGLKIFFWESTKLGFVVYPDWLSRAYDAPLFKDILRAVWALLSSLGLVGGIIYLIRKNSTARPDQEYLTVFFITCMILTYAFFYSLVCILTRYSTPLGPLFILIATLMFKTLSTKFLRPFKNQDQEK